MDIWSYLLTRCHIYPKNSDTQLLTILVLKGSDETPLFVASHLGLHCLLRPVCPNTYSKYDTAWLFRINLHGMARALFSKIVFELLSI